MAKAFKAFDLTDPRSRRAVHASVNQPVTTTNVNNLCIWSTNIRGLHANFDELKLRIEHTISAPDIICICETFINPAFADERAFSLPGFICHRRDRATHGGGLAVYHREHLACSVIYRSKVSETLWIHLKVQHEDLLFAVCYNPPNGAKDSITGEK